MQGYNRKCEKISTNLIFNLVKYGSGLCLSNVKPPSKWKRGGNSSRPDPGLIIYLDYPENIEEALET